MMAALGLLRILLVIISVNHVRSLALPDDQGNTGQCTIGICNQQSLDIRINYDAGFLDPDSTYLQQVCDARATYPSVTLTFLVGADVEPDDDGFLQCATFTEGDYDCTDDYKDACISQLVPNFTDYVCCLYGTPTDLDQEITEEGCYQKQNQDLNALASCVNKDGSSDINPEDILVNNKMTVAQDHPDDADCLPLIDYNLQPDACADEQLYDDAGTVICSMLAAGVEQACN